MAKYRTAMGKTLDMSALAAKHEKTRAVGNMPVNARGDTIDAAGNVIVPVTKKVNNKYQKSVSNRAANVVKRKNTGPQPTAAPSAPNVEPEELTKEELELEAEFEDEETFTIKPASEAPEFFKPEK